MIEEIEEYCKEDNVTKFLLEKKIDKESIAKVHAYSEECGGGFEEIYEIRKLWTVYFFIENISNEYLEIESIYAGFIDNFKNIQKITTPIQNKKDIKIGKMKIPPWKKIIIPIMTVIPEFDVPEIESNEYSNKYLSEENQIYGNGKILKNKENMDLIGPVIRPEKIQLTNGIIQKIHELDFDNIYFINRNWMCGSCPHIFFKKNEKLSYYGEIFSKSQDVMQNFEIIVPKKIDLFIIAELEKEITFLKEISINNKIIIINRKLYENDFISIKVKEGDYIRGIGMYSLIKKVEFKPQAIEKNQLIVKFIKEFNK